MYVEQLDRLIQAARERTIAALAWWADGLLGGLPETLRERLFVYREALTVRFVNDAMNVERLQANPSSGDTQSLASVPLAALEQEAPSIGNELGPRAAAAEVTLILPDELRLTRTLSLPAAAETSLESVLYHELDRLTPFDVAQCAFDYVVRSRDAKNDRLTVEFAMVDKAELERHVQLAHAAGIDPQTVTAANEEGETLPLNLLGNGTRPALPRLKVAPTPIMLGLAALAVATMLYLPPMRYEVLLDDYERTTQAERERAAEMRAALDAQEALAAGADYLEQRRQTYVRPIDLLLTLTDLLPDDTWLSRFAVSPDGVRIQGESAEPSDVLAIIESTGSLERAEFESPVSRSRTSGKQEFTIAATLAEGS